MTEPLPVIPLNYEKPAPRPWRWQRFMAAVAWLHCLLATTLMIAFDVETVLVTGPILLALGALLTIGGLVGRNYLAAAMGAAHIAICLLFFGLANLLHWGPRQATPPFTVMACLYTLAAALPTRMLWNGGRLRRMDAFS